MKTTKRMLRLAVPLAGALLLAAAGGQQHVVQEVAVSWHAQSGNSGAVGEEATATLTRTPGGIRYQIRTEGLTPGNAYTVWLVVVNDPAECSSVPCSGPTDIIPNPATDSQVTFAKAGMLATSERGGFRARFRAGPLLEGWLRVQGLDDPMGAEIHLVINSHGPVIAGLEEEMVSTYRAGCTDASLPAFFPPSAFADGTPGPNTCRLWQTAIFLPPAA